jgi:hypothetical protein
MRIVRKLRRRAQTLTDAADTIEWLIDEREALKERARAQAQAVEAAMAQLQTRTEWAIREIERLRAENDELTNFCLRLLETARTSPKVIGGPSSGA